MVRWSTSTALMIVGRLLFLEPLFLSNKQAVFFLGPISLSTKQALLPSCGESEICQSSTKAPPVCFPSPSSIGERCSCTFHLPATRKDLSPRDGHSMP